MTITRDELIRSKEYWLARLQAMLYQQVEEYLKKNKMTKSEFAHKMGVSKGYISQILNGNFDHKLSKFIELSLMIDKVPMLKLVDIEKIMVLVDKEGRLNESDSSANDITDSFDCDVELKKEKRGWVVNNGDETKT